MDADKLVKAYIKLRDEKDRILRDAEEQANILKSQMMVIEEALLDICKTTGQDGGKTSNGSFSRMVQTRYWTNDWANMYQFIADNDAMELLERRIHQGNMKTFLEEHPDKLPMGLNVDRAFSIRVTRPRGA